MDPLATTATPVIEPGSLVRFHLEVRFQDGLIALSTFDEEPVECRIGDGTLTSAFEAEIEGLPVGNEIQWVANGSELFGPYEESNRHWMDRADLPTGSSPAPGQVVAFSTPSGHEVCGIVLALEGPRAYVDLNHPFSGRHLSIRLRLLSVTAASSEAPFGLTGDPRAPASGR